MSKNTEIRKFINKQNALDTLRFITCGSVDDGKSTLLGRMLYEAHLIFDDQVDSLVSDSKKIGTQGGEIDFALLVDGLAAEREQGITIDVAYRFFSTEKRKFIVADSPGHEQYTRNMVTAASSAEIAIILIDARNGILPQTKRHSFIANLVGIKKIIVAVNKMDLINFEKDVFEQITDDYKKIVLSEVKFDEVSFIPVSALGGDNIIKNSPKTPWYSDKPLMSMLESINIDKTKKDIFSMPVQYVNRPNLNFRGFSGTISSGSLAVNDEIIVSSSLQAANVNEIYIADKNVESCNEGDAVTITLNKEIDISRGDILFNKSYKVEKSNAFLANLIWFNEEACFPNRSYILKSGNKQTGCEIIKIKNKININNYEKIAAGSLEMNDIAECELLLDNELCLLPYIENKTLGNYILIDKKSNLTVAAGTIKHDLRRATNVKWQDTEITRQKREKILNQKSFVVWFTGLSGSGKSTIANSLEKKLSSNGIVTYLLDGDNLRHGLNKDLGFKKEDRIENLRRVGEVAKILHDAGIVVLASFISPYKKDREAIKNLFTDEDFIEIHIDADLETVKSRDPKGLYAKAIEGKIPNFTGVSSAYEVPESPNIKINTKDTSAEKAVKKILEYLKEKNVIRD